MNLVILLLLTLTITVNATQFDLRDKNTMTTTNRIQINKTSEWLSAELNLDDISKRSSLIDQKRDTLILQIETLLKRSPSKDRLELKLRLGKLYVEQYYIHLAKADNDRSRALASQKLERARTLYSGLLQEYPKDPRRDQMIYFFALTSMDKGLNVESMRLFQELIDKYPKSVFRYDAMVQLGDYHFDKSNWQKAESYYMSLINSQYKPLTPYSVYKRAWCAYNLHRPAFALQSFKWVVVNEMRYAPKQKVRMEAVNDMTLPYADLKLTDDAHSFFYSQGPEVYRKGMEQIAFLLSERGSLDEAISIWQKLSVIDPIHYKNSEYDLKIVGAYRLKRDRKNALSHLNSVMPTYLGQTKWGAYNSQNRKGYEEQRRQWEDLLRNFAFEFHNEFDKTNNQENLIPAKDLYTDYILYFPKTPHSQKIHVNLARIYVVLKDSLKAAEHYYAAAQYGDDKALAETSFHDATRTLLTLLVTERSKQKLLNPESTEVIEKIAYTPNEERTSVVADEFMKKYPKHKDALPIRYELAYIHYLHADFERAYGDFEALYKSAPTSTQATASSYQMLDILGRHKAYPKMVTLCQELLKSGTQDSKYRHNIAGVLRTSELKQIELIEKDGKYELAAKEYLRYSDQYGKEDGALHQKALYNAAVNFGLAGKYNEALSTNERYYLQFPQTDKSPEVMLKIARAYELFAESPKAAQWYSSFHKLYPKHEQAPAALRLAGLHAWAGGQFPVAERLLLQSIADNSKTADLVRRDLLDLYESSPQRLAKLTRYYRGQLQERGLSNANEMIYRMKVAELTSERIGHAPKTLMEEAVAFAKSHQKSVRKSQQGIDAYAKAMFWELYQKERAFRNIKLGTNQAKLEANLKKKLAMIKELEADYLKLSKTGSPHWGLGSMYKTAQLYHDLGLEIQNAPVPKTLSAAQVDQYKVGVRDTFVRPFHEKALGLSKQCLEQATSLGIYSSWISKCYEVASRIDGPTFPSVRTFYLPAGFTGGLEPPSGARTPAGGSTSLPELYFSTGLFAAGSTDNVRRNPLNVMLNEEEMREVASTSTNPYGIGYQTQSQERDRRLSEALEALYPSKPGAPVTFAFLTSMRLKAPTKAVAFLKEAIRKDPENESLQHLLGQTYLEMGQIPAAKVTWLLQTARGTKSPQISNSLGLALLAEGREEDAIVTFEKAVSEGPQCDEAELNLGFLALKYRNGALAERYFGDLVQKGSGKYDVPTQVGLSVAKLHSREMESARDSINGFASRYSDDPYARLTAGYFLLDVEDNHEMATQVIGEYISKNPGAGSMMPFQRILQEARAKQSTENSKDGEQPKISSN